MSSVVSARPANSGSGPSTLIKDHLAGGASRLAALLLPQIPPVFSVVAPCHPGAALRDLVLVQRGQATGREPIRAAADRIGERDEAGAGEDEDEGRNHVAMPDERADVAAVRRRDRHAARD